MRGLVRARARHLAHCRGKGGGERDIRNLDPEMLHNAGPKETGGYWEGQSEAETAHIQVQ